MFKKIIITAAVLAFAASALAGCGCQKESDNKSTADSASSSAIISKDDGEVKGAPPAKEEKVDESSNGSQESKQQSSKQESKGESSKQQSSALPQFPTEKYELPFVPV